MQLTAPPERGLSRHPAAVYIAGLGSEASQDRVQSALNTVARLLGSGDAKTTPWEALRYGHMQALRGRLSREYAVSTPNKMLAAVRGVLRCAWRLRLTNDREYALATDVGSVPGSTLPAGRTLAEWEIRALCSSCSATGARDAAMLSLLLGCGLRRAEASTADYEDLEDERSTLRVQGKGRRERIAHITTERGRASTGGSTTAAAPPDRCCEP